MQLFPLRLLLRQDFAIIVTHSYWLEILDRVMEQYFGFASIYLNPYFRLWMSGTP